MCLILFAYHVNPRYKLILTANRDEFYDRPTATAHFWEDAPQVLAGRDLAHGGTWLGVTRTGRFGCVTNYRDPRQPKGTVSRGNLVSDFLLGVETVTQYLQKVENEAEKYTGFNLLVGDFGDGKDELAYFSNRGDGIKLLGAGIYGLSNHLLETPWKKVLKGKAGLAKIVTESEKVSLDSLFDVLQDRTFAKDEDLPDTGIGLETERIISSIFIETPIYGTRSSNVVLVGNDNSLSFSEESFHPALKRMTKDLIL